MFYRKRDTLCVSSKILQLFDCHPDAVAKGGRHESMVACFCVENQPETQKRRDLVLPRIPQTLMLI